MPPKTGIIVFTHGSRLAEGNDVVVRLVERLRARLGTDLVEPCFMEMATPDIPTAIEKLARKGCKHIFGYSLFLVAGRHLQKDIPEIIQRTLRDHPGLTCELTEPVMCDPALLDLVEQRIRRGLSERTPGSPP